MRAPSSTCSACSAVRSSGPADAEDAVMAGAIVETGRTRGRVGETTRAVAGRTFPLSFYLRDCGRRLPTDACPFGGRPARSRGRRRSPDWSCRAISPSRPRRGGLPERLWELRLRRPPFAFDARRQRSPDRRRIVRQPRAPQSRPTRDDVSGRCRRRSARRRRCRTGCRSSARFAAAPRGGARRDGRRRRATTRCTPQSLRPRAVARVW